MIQYPAKPTAAAPAAAPVLPQIMPGTGVMLAANALGIGLSVRARSGSRNHPFYPLLGVRTLKLSRGLVDGLYEPKIGKVPMSGDADHAAPALRLDPKEANEHGESWACLEVEPNAAGELTKDSRIEIVHTNAPVSRKKAVGRCPLVQILWRDGRPTRAFAIVMFNLRYVRVLPPPTGGVVSHLFL